MTQGSSQEVSLSTRLGPADSGDSVSKEAEHSPADMNCSGRLSVQDLIRSRNNHTGVTGTRADHPCTVLKSQSA